MLDFPATPTLNQQFSSGTSTWAWDGTAWNVVPQMTPAVASDTPPLNPAIGQGWWRGTNGKYYLWLDDGNSKQWVEVANGGAMDKVEPYPFATANMQLLSMAAGIVGLNTKADGTGTSSKLWTDANNTFSKALPGWLNFANGIVLQWGYSAGGDSTVVFPVPFPTNCGVVITTPLEGAGMPAGNAVVSMAATVSKTSFLMYNRYVIAGGVGVASEGSYWLAIGW